jgi:hypothetical protein
LLATFSKASGWCFKKNFFEFDIIFVKVIIKSGKSINECRRIIKIDDTTNFIAWASRFWDWHKFIFLKININLNFMIFLSVEIWLMLWASLEIPHIIHISF